MNRLTRRIIISIIAAVILLYAAGRTYQVIASAVDQQTYPPPGEMVAINGHRMHLYCQGSAEEGAPTVVFEAGLGSNLLVWSKVQPEVAKFTRACAYDHPGLGWSDSSSAAPDSNQIANDLHLLLETAGVKPPYVLAAHSMGALHARVFTYLFPNDVKGMVLVDGMPADQFERNPRAQMQTDQQINNLQLCEAAAPLGLIRFTNGASVPGLPEDLVKINHAISSRSTVCSAALAEYLLLEKSSNEVKSAGKLGSRPLVVIYNVPAIPAAADLPEGTTAEEVDQSIRSGIEMQEELAALSSNSIIIRLEGVGHAIQLQKPEVVVTAIKNVVDQVQK